MTGLLAGLCVTCAVWCVAAPGGRRATDLLGPSRRAGGRRWWPRRVGTDSRAPDRVRVALARVVALLRAGASPTTAWTRGLGVPTGADGVPDAGRLAEVLTEPRRTAAVLAGARLSRDVGAPLGQVLEAVADALVAEDEAADERDAALAGPQTTARVLAWLPVLGVLLGAVLGADPVGTATDGGFGTAAVVAGTVSLAVGRWWTARLVGEARRAGAEP
ncbi:hypothetical protein [Isoptericola haloaureus]|uniref:Tight adherence protein B n=1 Tax=Isoptericola haloaureus TaxID=1542902 RepID=A0ABU7Z9M9_9MICO